MVRAMCGVKLMDKKKINELMEMLGLEGTVDQLAKANAVQWYGHVLRRDDDHVLRKALNFEVMCPRKRGRPKMMWKKQVEEEIKKIGLKKEDALNRVRWCNGVRSIASRVR